MKYDEIGGQQENMIKNINNRLGLRVQKLLRYL